MSTDGQFLQQLKDYLGQSSDGIELTTPIFRNDDGSINREKTLALPCFADFKQEKETL